MKFRIGQNQILSIQQVRCTNFSLNPHIINLERTDLNMLSGRKCVSCQKLDLLVFRSQIPTLFIEIIA